MADGPMMIGDLGTAFGNSVPQGTFSAPGGPTDKERVEKILRRHRAMKREKQPWLATYQVCGEYIFLRRQDFTRMLAPGQFLTGRIFDSTAPRTLHQMASALIGSLWPGGEKKFVLKVPMSMSAEDRETDEVKDWYRRAAKVMHESLNHPRAGLTLALEEYMNDQGAFGISGIGTWENDSKEIPITFRAVDTKQLTIDQGKDGFIDTVYIEREISVRQVVEEFGLENCSDRVKEMWANGTTGQPKENVKVLQAIEPRTDRNVWGFGNANYPISSIHVEIDNHHILRESGYHDMPVHIARFYRAMSEKYGRSPGMEVMPDVLEINAMREAMIIAIEKMLNPPLAVTQSGVDGGGTINTSAGGISVRITNGRMGETQGKWIEPIMTVGDLKPAQARIEQIEQIISQTFLMDRLLDLNNETRMTLGEANIRDKLRGQSLGCVYSRQISELFTPLIQRVFNILLGKGLLGVAMNSPGYWEQIQKGVKEPFVIPDAIVKVMAAGDNVYDIEYLTPAARIMRAEELMGIQQTAGFMEQLAPTNPGIFSYFDMRVMVERVVELTGCPTDVVLSLKAFKQAQQAQAQAQAKQVAVDQGHIQAQTARAAGQAAEATAKAGIPPQAVLGGLAQPAGGPQAQGGVPQ